MTTQLPKHLHHRLDSLIAREMAALIWKTKTTIKLTEAVAFEIRNIESLLANKDRPWSISIGHVIPRDAQFTSLGDACGIGGGAFCHELQYWFDVVWSDHTRQQFNIGKIHINILEFVVVLLQLAAAITRDEQAFQVNGRSILPLHKLLIRSDNSPSYISKGAEVAVLQLFPPQSRTLIMPGVQAVHRTLASKPASTKVARTIRNRRLHYFIFCFDMKLDDDWLLENQSQERANFQLAMYATHLATGSSLHCRAIKASTIASYLHDIATFLGRFRPIDPRFISAADAALAPVIAKVIAEQRRWEMVPNRREPFTVEMHLAIANFPSSQKDDCCLTAAMANWTLCNLYAGCRGIEWAQTQLIHRPLNTFHKNRFKNAYAFTLNDVLCFTITSSPLTFAQALATPSRVEKIKLRFEEQKNGENGEWKLFTRNNSNTNLCFVSNFLQILARHKRLANSSPTQPLSVYRGNDGVAYNITTVDIDATLRAAAAKVYQLDPTAHRATLQLWSSHSLRVGACTLLYSKGFSEMEIKYLLRWKSNAFMTYLRNLAVTSRRQNDAVNDTSEIPNFV
ncbi:hypothetical protein MHU86_3488 [Fragilaria crotonensis]|nr:hypothetical protein MHU86_3488 [Fragilaria crotonensis]